MQTLLLFLSFFSTPDMIYVPTMGKAPFIKGERVVDKELNPHVEEFERHWKKKIDFTVTFSKLKDQHAGVCYIYLTSKIVYIDKSYYKHLTYLQQEELVFHELGHCALRRLHNPKLRQFDDVYGYHPESIMYPSVFTVYDIEVYKNNRDYYINELFNE